MSEENRAEELSLDELDQVTGGRKIGGSLGPGLSFGGKEIIGAKNTSGTYKCPKCGETMSMKDVPMHECGKRYV